MRKEVKKTMDVCDFCGTDNSVFYKCLQCGKDACWECRDKTVQYPQGVYISGGQDGIYCLECDSTLMKSGDKLHRAYNIIEALRNESKIWGEDFHARSKKAEDNILKLRGVK